MALFKVEKEQKLKKINLKSFTNERELQRLCENNLEELFQVRFVATEFSTGEVHGGRIDTIGLDYENNPVIIEYKLDKNNTVLNQGLFYMDWLVDHKGDFELAVKNKLGSDTKIEWSNPKLFLVAQEYSKYDKHAVNRIGYDISMFKYLFYEDGSFYVENIVYNDNIKNENKPVQKQVIARNETGKYEHREYSLEDHTNGKSDKVIDLYKELDERIMAINDQIERKYRRVYIGYSTTRNFAEVHLQSNGIQIFVLVEKGCKSDYQDKLVVVPDSYQWVVKSKLTINSLDEIDYALNIIKESYEMTL